MIDQKLIKEVHDDYHFFNSLPLHWAVIDITKGNVRLLIGQKRLDGVREIPLVRRDYYIDRLTKQARFTVYGNG